MENSIRVYSKQTAFCPKTNQEQDGSKCMSCEFYNNRRIEAERLFIDCKFGKQAEV